MLKEIFDRRSVRHYTSQPVERETLVELLRAAMNAPTAKNTQEWRFIVITDRPTLDHIAEIHPFAKMMLQAQAAILVTVDVPSAYTEGHAYLDGGAAIENILLEAVHQGLGTCWCGLAPLEERVTSFRDCFHLPEGQVPIGVISIGYPERVRPRVDQYDEQKVIWWEG